MSERSRFDPVALRAGGSVCLVFAVPLSIAARWASDREDSGGLAALFTLGALVGFVLGAGVAAWVQDRELPLAHGLVTAIGAYLLAQAVFVTARLVRGADVRWSAIVSNLALVLGTGLLGGWLGASLRRKGAVPTIARRPPGEEGDVP